MSAPRAAAREIVPRFQPNSSLMGSTKTPKPPPPPIARKAMTHVDAGTAHPYDTPERAVLSRMRKTLLNVPLITREPGRMKRGAALPFPQSCLVGQVA